ncbi:hypothetical protein DQ353_20205 [Arthrobacter sp. AQ5-05]|uniref:hypothetical protein n=1 Tax=Arthrobacter sp. AQ5-05 TaxID=2184581 RepID=UPI000DCDDDAE|nr:hypothetical protein [Arthrobacter sp. AQ5-05]RAX46545.1 hypothetical protein DQ353_20205 [Arthrobacter sp. AQ5-05]
MKTLAARVFGRAVGAQGDEGEERQHPGGQEQSAGHLERAFPLQMRAATLVNDVAGQDDGPHEHEARPEIVVAGVKVPAT